MGISKDDPITVSHPDPPNWRGISWHARFGQRALDVREPGQLWVACAGSPALMKPIEKCLGSSVLIGPHPPGQGLYVDFDKGATPSFFFFLFFFFFSTCFFTSLSSPLPAPDAVECAWTRTHARWNAEEISRQNVWLECQNECLNNCQIKCQNRCQIE